MVEILSQCPTNWSMNPTDAVEWLEKNMMPVFPLGEVKNTL
jgi:2-oxoglutarate ferredoxin oxidoreductase subunit beta